MNAPQIRDAGIAASATAAAMIGFQVAARATRDAFFLSNYTVASLPIMMMTSAVLSVALAYLSTRAMTRWGPERVMPVSFAGSALLLLIEYAISFGSPRAAAVLLYYHYGAMGALLISGFWSFLGERFDPRTAKRYIGRIGAAGSVGGLLGGVTAAQVGNVLPVTAMMPILALFHLVCAGTISRLRSVAPAAPASAVPQGGTDATRVRALIATPYIRNMILLVLLLSASEGLLDLVLQGRASATLTQADLLRFFAAFYTGVALVTILVQAAGSRFVLERLGVARTVSILPAGVAATSVAAMAAPGMTGAAVARGTAGVFSNSLFRAGYEVLFTPVPAREKRAIKTLADVGGSRLGDIAAAAIGQAIVLMAMPIQGTALLTAVITLSLAALFVAYRLHAGYVQALARGLVSRAVQLDLSEVKDATTRSTLLRTLGPGGLRTLDPLAGGSGTSGGDEDLAQLVLIRDLHSRDLDRVCRALRGKPIPASLASSVVPLLAWDEVAQDAIASLRRIGPEATDDLVAHLVDPEVEFIIRRRIPLVLGTYKDPRAVAGLLRGAADKRFEVRYRCGRALAHLLSIDASLSVTREEAYGAVLREVASAAGIWEGRNLLDRMDDEGWSPVVDELVRDRANRSLEHVFTLLALVLPRQPLRIAFKGLHTDDPLLRGTALEYLESSLPPMIRRALWPYLEDNRPRRAKPARPTDKALQDLLDSSDSIVIKLEELRRKEREEPGA